MANKVTELGVKMTTVAPLYTGEVRVEDKKSARVNFPVRKAATGKAIVPFKGALRATLEIMLSAKGEKVCDTGKSRSQPCGRCVLCGLFGSMGRKGKATIDFLMSEEDKNTIVRESAHVRIDRQAGSVSDSFKAEEVIEGAVFKSNIFINDPQNGDVELMEAAMKYLEENGVGGWTNKGYGRVKFEISKKDVTKDRYLR